MKKFPLDLSKFKKIHDAEDHAILKHPDGHEFKVAKKPLSKGVLKQLDELTPVAKMASGGSTPPSSGSPAIDPNKAKEIEKGATKSGWNPDQWKKNIKEGLGLAEGGKVSADDELIAKKKQVDDYNNQHEDEPKEYPQDVIAKMQKTEVKQYAEGSDDVGNEEPSQPDNSAPAPQPPVNISINAQPIPMQQASQPAPSLQDTSNKLAQMQQPDNANREPAQEQPVDAQQAPQVTQPSAQTAQPTGANAETPDSLGGYQKQVGALQGLGDEEAKAAAQAAGIYKGQAAAQAEMAQSYQDHYNDLDQERKSFQQDIIDKHIDPNRFLGHQDTIGKVSTAIGLILGGIGGGATGHNAALEFLNNQINRDIEAQKAELGKSENLLSANLRQFGNLKDATEMTRVMMNDSISSSLKAAAAKAQSPMAKLNAQRAIGVLEMQSAPVIQQMAMQRALRANGSAQESQDPATYVPFVVPEPHQKEVFNEIKIAQNAAQNKDAIMKAFDDAAKENTVVGRAEHLGFSPASILSMRSMMLPMIHDLEGRVNEFEQKTTSDLEPKPGDTAAKVAAKKKALEQFIDQKAAAPTAKGFGIDLNKFKSTSTDPVARMSPKEQAFVKFARENPNDPRSAMILKKLGLNN